MKRRDEIDFANIGKFEDLVNKDFEKEKSMLILENNKNSVVMIVCYELKGQFLTLNCYQNLDNILEPRKIISDINLKCAKKRIPNSTELYHILRENI